MEDGSYVCYKQSFDEALTQVKYFVSGNSINLSKVDQERKLDEILAKKAPTNQDALEAVVGLVIQIDAEEDEEEEGGNPCLLSRFIVINSFFF